MKKARAAFSIKYVPCPPEHAARWREGMRLLAEMIMEMDPDALEAQQESVTNEVVVGVAPSSYRPLYEEGILDGTPATRLAAE